MEWLAPTIALIGVLLSAGISAVISILATRKSGTQKLANYRREWIEELRHMIANYMSLAFEIQVLKLSEDGTAYSKELIALMKEQDTQFFKIAMNLNPEEKSHKELEDALKKIGEIEGEYEKNSVIPLSRSVLKAEWDRLKNEL